MDDITITAVAVGIGLLVLSKPINKISGLIPDIPGLTTDIHDLQNGSVGINPEFINFAWNQMPILGLLPDPFVVNS